MAKRIGLLTGGADAPGQNFCLKTIVYNAIDHGYEVVGIRKGWEGLIHYDPEDPVTHADNAMIMTKPRVRDIDRSPGSFLHCSRIDPARLDPQDAPLALRVGAADHPLDLTNHIKRAISHLQLDALLVLGSNTSLKFGARLNREGVPVIGIPKSVHNDIPGTAYTLGTSTAIRRGVGFIREVREIVASREEVAVVSVLGHQCGLTTMFISMFAGADRTLIPEVAFDPYRLGELLLDDQRRNPSNYAMLVMSENAQVDPTRAPELVAQLSADVVVAGQRGSGSMVVRILEEVTQQRFLHQPLSYLTRTGDADGWDLLAATNFGITAVDLVAQGQTGRMVAFRLEKGYVDVPLEDVTQPYGVDVAGFYDTTTYTVKSNIFSIGAIRSIGL